MLNKECACALSLNSVCVLLLCWWHAYNICLIIVSQHTESVRVRLKYVCTYHILYVVVSVFVLLPLLIDDGTFVSMKVC